MDRDILERWGDYDPILQGWWFGGRFYGRTSVADPGGGHDVDWLAAFRLADAVSQVADDLGESWRPSFGNVDAPI